MKSDQQGKAQLHSEGICPTGHNYSLDAELQTSSLSVIQKSPVGVWIQMLVFGVLESSAWWKNKTKQNKRAMKRNMNLKTAIIPSLLFVFLFVQNHIVAACTPLQYQQSLYGTLNFKATGGPQGPHFKDGFDEMQQYLCNTDSGSLNASCSLHPAKVQLGKI